MARIPRYTQDKLASGLVGTAGVDTSGQQLFNSISQDASQVSSALYQLGNQEYQQQQYELRQRQAEQRALERQQKQLLEDVEVESHLGQLDLQLGDAANQTKDSRIKNPEGAGTDYMKSQTPTVNDYADGITNERVRERVRLGGMKAASQKANAITTWEPTQRTANAQASLETTIAGYVNQAGNVDTLLGVQEINTKLDGMRPSLAIAYGEKSDEVVRKAKSDVAKQYLDSIMIKDHNRVRPTIESGAFDSVLNAGQREELIARALKYQKAEEKEIDIQDQVNVLNKRVTIADTVVKTDESNYQSLKGTNEALHKALAEETSKPAKKQDITIVNQIKSEIQRNENLLENFGKEEDKKKKEAALKVYQSPDAMNTRLALTKERAAIAATKYKSKDDELKALQAYDAKVQKAQKNGWLDSPGSINRWESESQFVTSKMEKLRNKKESPFQQLQKGVSSLFNEANKYFNSTPPAPGKTSLQTKDALGTAYQTKVQSLVQQYKRVYGKDPDASALKTIDGLARQGAVKEVHGGK